jgi:methyl-accepting chemotaxis protein
MASMTKQNAENANQANALMNKTRQIVEQANGSMAHLTASMDEISKASEATSKIVKTIDEIAFQTNLLALNAAVEAARAGEAGAGFAVVADEVRNLAMRAAEAAKNTADLIEGTVKKIKEGSEVVQKTNTEFSEVQTSSARMGELVGEISAASGEQAQGIEQISKAVSEMDKVVQTNSANAEESASASEEMSAQAEQMKQFVAELVTMVEGANGHSTVEGVTALRTKVALKKDAKGPKMVAAYEKRANGHLGAGDGNASVILSKRHSGPEQLIPFDDAEVSDF